MLKVRDNREGLNRRIDFARVLVGAVFAILAMAYWYTQIVRGDYYYTLSESNRIRSVRINAPRGYVLDRNGAVLVDNEPAYTLHMRPPVLVAPGETIRIRVTPNLARLLAEQERGILDDVQQKLGVDLEIIPDETLKPEEYEILNR